MFFNKQKLLVSPKGDTDLIINEANAITFYIKEVISEDELTHVSFQAFTRDLKNITILSNYVLITEDLPNEYVVTYTPTTLQKDNLYFNFKVITSSGLTHVVSSPAFSVVPAGVTPWVSYKITFKRCFLVLTL